MNTKQKVHTIDAKTTTTTITKLRRNTVTYIMIFFISGEVLRSEIFQGRYIDGLYGSIALETLNLGHNDIHSLDRYLFQYTPNLTRLYLNNNPIEILDHVTLLALSSAVNLQVRKLSN